MYLLACNKIKNRCVEISRQQPFITNGRFGQKDWNLVPTANGWKERSNECSYVCRCRNLLESKHPIQPLNPFATRKENPILWLRQPVRVLVLLKSCGNGLRGSMMSRGIYHHACRPVIERLHHLAFVERRPLARRVRKIGAVPVLGLTRAKLSAVNGKQCSRLSSSEILWR